jgi:hypothetical protein
MCNCIQDYCAYCRFDSSLAYMRSNVGFYHHQKLMMHCRRKRYELYHRALGTEIYLMTLNCSPLVAKISVYWWSPRSKPMPLIFV